jgi:hypothetical protein
MIEGPLTAAGLLAIPDLSKIFFFAVKVLMAATGALLGWLVGGPVARLLVRLAFQRPASKTMLGLSRVGCAVLFGFLAFLIPLGTGFGSGGSGSGGKDRGGDRPMTADKGNAAQDKPGRAKEEVNSVLAVYVLGGEAVVGGRFYRVKLEGQNKTLTREDLRKIIEEDRAGPHRYTRLDIHWDDDSVLPTSEVVTRLEDLGRQSKLRVRVIQDIPPAKGDSGKD